MKTKEQSSLEIASDSSNSTSEPSLEIIRHVLEIVGASPSKGHVFPLWTRRWTVLCRTMGHLIDPMPQGHLQRSSAIFTASEGSDPGSPAARQASEAARVDIRPLRGWRDRARFVALP